MQSYVKSTVLVVAAFTLAVAAQAQEKDVDGKSVFNFEVEARKPAQVDLDRTLLSDSRLGLSADVNSYVDSVIHMIVPVLQQYGLDPMSLPEVVEGFSVRYLLITYSAWLKIHDGYLTGITKVERHGDQMVHYFAKMLRVRVVLNFKDMLFNYNYLVQVMNIGPTGVIEARLDRYVVVVDVLIDFNNDEVHLQEFSISEIGRLSVRFTISILLDWLINPILNVFVRIFDGVIIRVVEGAIFSTVTSIIAIINGNIASAISAIESYN